MVDNYYRWDFVGLSTDEKPTPEDSELVTDGSTYYCSDTSKLYIWYKDQWYEKSGSGGGGTTYTAGNGLTLTGTEFSVNTSTIATQNDLTTGLSTKQDTLTAGDNITISEDTISATDTTYSNFTGTDGTSAGTAGLVPAPATTDTDKFLKSDGTWATASGGSITPVQTPGTSTTDVMSQNATTSMVYADPSTTQKVSIGGSIDSGSAYGTAVGYQAVIIAGANRAVAIGYRAGANESGSVALGTGSAASRIGEVNIGSLASTAYGFNNSNYRLLSGVYDGQSAHDAATYGQVISYAAINGAGAPTTATEGKYVGQLYYDTTNESMYFLKTIDTTTDPATYTWEALGGGGSITPVQTTGTSTTDVMSQNAVTNMVFYDPSSRRKIGIGLNTVVFGTNGVAVGDSAWAAADGSVALGASARTTAIGQVMIGTNVTSYGYNSSNYRLLSGVYDPQSAHDAATKGYVDPTTDSTAPTTSTVGRLGQIQIDTATATAYMCVAADSGTSTYTWKQITA